MCLYGSLTVVIVKKSPTTLRRAFCFLCQKLFLFLAAFFAAGEGFVAQTSEASANQWSHDEHPEVCQGRTACEDGL